MGLLNAEKKYTLHFFGIQKLKESATHKQFHTDKYTGIPTKHLLPPPSSNKIYIKNEVTDEKIN